MIVDLKVFFLLELRTLTAHFQVPTYLLTYLLTNLLTYLLLGAESFLRR